MADYKYLSIEEENRLREKVDKYKLGCALLAMAMGASIFLNILFVLESRGNNASSDISISEYIDLEELGYNHDHTLYRDRNTNVLYLQIKYSGGIAMIPIINPDGTAKLYEGD